MASGDVVFEKDNMYIVTNEAESGQGTTVLNASAGGSVTVVNPSGSGVHETVFDAAKTYDVIVKEH
jgi:hypothetical protein